MKTASLASNAVPCALCLTAVVLGSVLALTDAVGTDRAASLGLGVMPRSGLLQAGTTSTANGSDFNARCHAAGVVKCVGFDSASEIDPFVMKDSQGVVRATLDSTVKASGGGSLRFEIPPRSGQNSSGAWTARLGGSFGAGKTFYVQYRQRFSPEFLKERYAGGEGWKQSIFHMGSKTCGDLELTTVNAYYRGFPIMYTACGSRDFKTDLRNGDFLLEQSDPSSGGYNCHYQKPSPGSCAFYKADEWMTFYYQVSVGIWGQPNSTIKAWVGYERQPLKQFVSATKYRLDFNDGPFDAFDSISLLPYNTGKSSAQDYPVAYTWYDELVVSTKPIAAPALSK